MKLYETGVLLNLRNSDLVELIKLDCELEKKDTITIDDYRNIIVIMPGLSMALEKYWELPIHEAIYMVKCNILRYSKIDKLLNLYVQYKRSKQNNESCLHREKRY